VVSSLLDPTANFCNKANRTWVSIKHASTLMEPRPYGGGLGYLICPSLAVVNLVSHLPTLLGPWEVGDWDDEERVRGIGDTG
jgi:hypothetical protein